MLTHRLLKLAQRRIVFAAPQHGLRQAQRGRTGRTIRTRRGTRPGRLAMTTLRLSISLAGHRGLSQEREEGKRGGGDSVLSTHFAGCCCASPVIGTNRTGRIECRRAAVGGFCDNRTSAGRRRRPASPPAAGGELLDQGRRHVIGGGGQDDHVERRVLGPAAVAVAGADGEVL